MTTRQTEVWDQNHIGSLLVEALKNGGAELTALDNNSELTIKLDARGVRQLRLELQRIERDAAQ